MIAPYRRKNPENFFVKGARFSPPLPEKKERTLPLQRKPPLYLKEMGGFFFFFCEGFFRGYFIPPKGKWKRKKTL